MKNFFLSHKIFCIIIASILALGAITAILLATRDNIDTEQDNSNKAVSSTISIPDISDDTSSKELLSDSNNYISPDEELASSSSASSTATSSQKQTEIIQSSTPTQPTTSSQAPAATTPQQTTTPTQPSTPEKQPGLSESTNKPLNEWQFEFDEEELKGACCDCCGLPLGDGTNGTCEGSSEIPFFENGQLKIRFVCKNNEKVVIFEE